MNANQNTAPQYDKNVGDTIHFAKLREQVKLILPTLPASRLIVTKFKAIILPAIYLGFYTVAQFQTSFLLFCLAYVFMGLMLVIIFLNLVHEACHNILFKSKKINRRFITLFDLIGANSYMWKKRHIMLHHNYPNVAGWDSDIEKSKFLKVHPLDHKKKSHQYQYFIVLLYPLFITNWFLVRDFKDFFNPNMIVRKVTKVPLQEYFKLFFFKLFFIGYLVVVPAFITNFSWAQIVLALFLMLLTAGLFALTVLLPPHVNSNNQFPVADSKMNLKQSWLLHQLITTNDVNTKNWFSRHIMANSNLHVVHHLFPNISYVYAEEITEIIKNYCKHEGLPYKSYSLFKTFKDHFNLIKRNGLSINIMEESL